MGTSSNASAFFAWRMASFINFSCSVTCSPLFYQWFRVQKKPEHIMSSSFLLCSRSDGIRTHDLCVPNAALYQTEPRFVNASDIILIKSQFVNRFFQIFLIFSNIFLSWSYTLLNLVLRREDFGWISAFYRICIWPSEENIRKNLKNLKKSIDKLRFY